MAGGNQQIEDRAAEFLAKRDGGNWTDEDQARFSRWMEASTAHRVAVLRLEAGWRGARRLQVLSAGALPDVVPPKGAWRRSPYFGQEASLRDRGPDLFQFAKADLRGRAKFFAAAAALVLAVLGVVSYVISAGGERYSTPIGGVESVALRDGSRITLNTSSKLRVELNSRERRIDLERGEAFFEVARDPKRPFVVRAGNKRVVAVGTQFSVSREGDDIKVAVSEGTVRLETDGPLLQVKRRGGGRNPLSIDSAAMPLLAGSLAQIKDQSLMVQDAAMSQVQDVLSWRQGLLTFHDTPLAEAIEQFNRYNLHKIVIGDPAVAAIRISGAFRPTNYESFVHLLEAGFFLHASSTADQTALTQ